MNPLPSFISRAIKNLRTVRIIPSREACPRCIWDYETGPDLCQRCWRNPRRDIKDTQKDIERCEQCGEIVPPEYHTIGIEYQGEPERFGSVYYLAGYDCPNCGYHMET